MEKIGSVQFMSLLLLFQIGSYVIFGFASEAKQDSWIVALLSAAAGFLLSTLYLALYRLSPGEDHVALFERILGRLLGRLLVLVYGLTFVYVAGRVLRDFGELITALILPFTPLFVILICLTALIFYGVRLGLEPIGRVAEMALVFLLSMLVIQIVLLAGSGVIHAEYLEPVAHHKMEILKNVWPLGVTVPFGETIVFLTFYHQVSRQRQLRALVWSGVAVSGSLLALLNALAVATLGPDLYARTIYPIFTAFQQVSIADFVENLDALIAVYVGVAAFFKITVFLYAASKSIAGVLRLENDRVPLAPLTLLMLLCAVFMSRNVPEHVFVGLRWVPHAMWVPLFVVVPLAVYVTGLVRLRGDRREGGTSDVEAKEA